MRGTGLFLNRIGIAKLLVRFSDMFEGQKSADRKQYDLLSQPMECGFVHQLLEISCIPTSVCSFSSWLDSVRLLLWETWSHTCAYAWHTKELSKSALWMLKTYQPRYPDESQSYGQEVYHCCNLGIGDMPFAKQLIFSVICPTSCRHWLEINEQLIKHLLTIEINQPHLPSTNPIYHDHCFWIRQYTGMDQHQINTKSSQKMWLDDVNPSQLRASSVRTGY